jgi:hypothetical protein
VHVINVFTSLLSVVTPCSRAFRYPAVVALADVDAAELGVAGADLEPPPHPATAEALITTARATTLSGLHSVIVMSRG